MNKDVLAFPVSVEKVMSPATVRLRASDLLGRALTGSTHFKVNLDRLANAADEVVAMTRSNYPTLQIPFHARMRHFAVGGIDRIAHLEPALSKLGAEERARTLIDLVVVSVLLDAGAGMAWRYQEPSSGKIWSKSEGLAVASLDLFLSGAFSSNPSCPWRADAQGLKSFNLQKFEQGFQVSAANPLVGAQGRVLLLNQLGHAIEQKPELFRVQGSSAVEASFRPGGLFDVLKADAQAQGALRAERVLRAVQVGFGSIWPGRVVVDGVNLGDVWNYPGLAGDGLMPFHKLSQWMTYSLLEPLAAAGLEAQGLDDLTGLPEYRNGGLFLDSGVIELRDPALKDKEHTVDSLLVVEWRALTVALLDRIAPLVRERLGVDKRDFPLAKVLEGGTWWAGRKLAAQLRTDGGSPLKIKSDGTVF